MLLATSRQGWAPLREDHVHGLLPVWVWALLLVAYLGVVITGVVVMARATTRMSRPGRILVRLIALWAAGAAVVVFVDAYRPTGDWLGGVLEASFAVLYGLVASAIVWAVDKGVRQLRTTSPV